MPVTGDMPMRSVLSTRASSVWWLAVAILVAATARCWLLHEGFSPAFLPISSLAGVPVLVQKEFPRCSCYAGGRRGGGEGMEEQWSTWIWQVGSGSFSPMKLKELRRLLIPLECGSRWAVYFASPVTLLVEGRPFEAAAQASARLFSSSRRHAIREAVLLGCRFHAYLLLRWFGKMGWRAADVKWFVPDGGWCVPVLRRQPGPDCVSSSLLGVLFVKSMDWFVISVLLCPLSWSVPSLCIE